MANEITLGRKLPFKNSIGGIQALYFMILGDATGFTMDATNTDVIEAVTGTPSAMKYEVKGAGTTFTQTPVSSIETGVTSFEQKLTVSLPKLTLEMHKELKLMCWNQLQVIIKDNNDNYFLMGKKFGVDVTGGSIVNGGAIADMSGYTIEMVGVEPVAANFFEATTDALLTTAGVTIVLGA